MICRHCFREPQAGEAHGFLVCDGGPGKSAAVKPDTLLGGFWAENAWREPRYFESQRRYEKALDESGLMLKPREKGVAITAHTLAQAEALVRRVTARQKTVPIAERVLEETITVRAES